MGVVGPFSKRKRTMNRTSSWIGRLLSRTKKLQRTRRGIRKRFSVEQLESRQLLTGDLHTVIEAIDAPPVAAVVAHEVAPLQQSQQDSVALAGVGGFFQGLGNGLYNMGTGVYNLGHDLVTMPIDLVGTTVSSTYQPISYYGQASQAAIQNGTPWYYMSGQTAINAVTLGTYGLATTGYQYYQTGDPTAFQQTTGAFAFTVFVAYGVQQYTSPANAPTYNLGGTGAPGEPVGVINVQPPGAPIPPEPYIIAPSNQLPIAPGSGNVIVNNSPISPQGGGITGPYGPLGPPYMPNQISGIAKGGYTITITQSSSTPGIPTPGQTAVINVFPPGYKVVVLPVPPYATTVVITTPTPLTTTVAPYAPIVIQGPNPQLVSGNP
jgi:hypothetical protein